GVRGGEMRCYFSILHTLALQIRPDSRWPERAGRADPTVCTATRPNGLSFSLGITTLLIPLFWRHRWHSGDFTAAWRTLPWLVCRWECRGRRLSRCEGSPDRQFWRR